VTNGELGRNDDAAVLSTVGFATKSAGDVAAWAALVAAGAVKVAEVLVLLRKVHHIVVHVTPSALESFWTVAERVRGVVGVHRGRGRRDRHTLGDWSIRRGR